MEFLEVLQSQGHFTSQRQVTAANANMNSTQPQCLQPEFATYPILASRGEVLHVYTEVKWALLQFARARTDAVFALDRGHLKELAQQAQVQRKRWRPSSGRLLRQEILDPNCAMQPPSVKCLHPALVLGFTVAPFALQLAAASVVKSKG
eukprot:scaffold31899_cov17-Tisochrysis_lutea.AAC.3